MWKLLTAAPTPRLFVIRITLGVALLQALWILVVPPFRASDEFDHAYRAAAVADGQWRATRSAEEGRGILVRVPRDIVEAASKQCAALGYVGHDNCFPAGDAGDGHVWVGSGAGTYNPAFYWVIGTAAQPFKGAGALYAMRITAALLCLLFVCLAAWALSRARTPGWSGVAFALALSPVLVFSTAVAAPNGLEMAAGVALWCSLASLPDIGNTRIGRRVLLVACAAAVVLGFLRVLGPLFILLTLATVAIFHGRRTLDVIRRYRRALAGCVVAVGLAVAWGVGWLWAVRGVGGGEQQGGSEWQVLTTLILWPLQAIAAFPFRDQAGPTVVYPVVVLAVGALLLLALRAARGGQRLAILLALAVALLLPAILTMATIDSRGVMWQGRYGLPYSVGFVLLAGTALEGRDRPLPHPAVLMSAAALLAAVWAACLAQVRSQELDRAESALDPMWHPPHVAVIALVCGVAWWLAVRAVKSGQGSSVGLTPHEGVREREVRAGS